jgi:serine/threonine protein kinase
VIFSPFTGTDKQKKLGKGEYLLGGNMSQLVKMLKFLSEPDVVLYTMEIVLTLETLHQMGTVRDIKLSNILLDSDGHIAVADYGLSKEFDPDKKRQRTYSLCGTNEYMAPEVHRCKGHSMTVDWWSIGIAIYKMLTGSTPYSASDLSDTSQPMAPIGQRWQKKTYLCLTIHLLVMRTVLTGVRT